MARRQGRAADQYLMRLFTQGMGEQFSIGTTHDRQTLKRFLRAAVPPNWRSQNKEEIENNPDGPVDGVAQLLCSGALSHPTMDE
jgi:hypothetical protein